MGTSVALEINTNDGTVMFLGTMNQGGTKIRGSHRVVGGTCGGSFGTGCFGRDFRSLCQLP
jgi:hypothetical protein